MHNIKNLNYQILFFPLYDIISFQGNRKFHEQDLRIEVLKCKVYQNILMNTRSHDEFDRLLQPHMLDNTEEDNDMSWKCCKAVEYSKEKGDDNRSKN
jgi:hypothetical protein